MISNQERSQIRVLTQDPKFQAIRDLAESLKNKISLSSAMRDSQWETLKATILKDGQVEGINLFLQELETQSQL